MIHNVKIKGAAVYGLQRAFLVDWFFVCRALITDRSYYPEIITEENDCLAQIVTSSPTSLWPEIEQGYVSVLCSAKHYVYMEPPISCLLILFSLLCERLLCRELMCV